MDCRNEVSGTSIDSRGTTHMVCQNDARGKEVEGRHEPESAHREAETGFLVVGVGASGGWRRLISSSGPPPPAAV
jgi:hypothetical protein